MELTKRQKMYRDEIQSFFRENDQLPPCKKLANLMGVTNNAAAEALKKLELRGVIEKNDVNKWKRGINFHGRI